MEQEIPEKQPGEALREMLARSQQISGQVPPVVLSQEIGLSSESGLSWQDKVARKRKRQILRIIATRSALVGFVLMMSRFVAIGLATVPGARVDDVDSFAWFCLGLLVLYVPIGFNCVVLAGGLLVARASLR